MSKENQSITTLRDAYATVKRELARLDLTISFLLTIHRLADEKGRLPEDFETEKKNKEAVISAFREAIPILVKFGTSRDIDCRALEAIVVDLPVTNEMRNVWEYNAGEACAPLSEIGALIDM